MQLNPGQRSILAYFADENSAKNAAARLKQEGFSEVQVDTISRFPSGKKGYGLTSSLSSLVIGQDYDRCLGVLLAADPSVSGSATGDLVGGYPYLVTVVTENEKTNQALNILRQHGAYV
ncbi:hypothetical protein SAMN02745221_01621 [Thermosyntropha lipolytica DSM 11003]|uniref:Heat induced stress protein YflT n=1 Tax=Thermosyntropha lipolytica DSM 11003 TaxID=1123382 RepID=A0A1M5PZ84_9FIRM|nr:hypothetical protein [Thermosyntropha lipolytica]SHH07327.1 hypothetical protein SAMN02745221_01621 [Thermosyntropha lipolytica DSM 11003]